MRVSVPRSGGRSQVPIPLMGALFIGLLFTLLGLAISHLHADTLLARWKTAAPLPTPFARPAVARYDDVIIVVGGRTAQNTRSPFSYVGTIGENAIITGWAQQQAPGLEPGISHASLVASQEGWLYLTGGYDGSRVLDTTYVSKIQSENVITHWERSSYRFSPRDLHTSEISGTRLYVIGGWDGRKLLNDIQLTQVDVNQGVVTTPWFSAGSLTPARAAHATALFDGRLYVIGGLIPQGSNSTTVTDSVVYAEINPDGKLGPWQPTSSLIKPLAYHTAVLLESQREIYVIGGRSLDNKGVPLTVEQVYSATILSNGALSDWQPVSSLSLSPPRHRHASAYGGNGSIYLIGGEADSGVINDVSYIPSLDLTKSNVPSGPVHEGDVIAYTIAYTNTSLITQTITITDPLPFGLTLIPGSTAPPGDEKPHSVVWNLGDKAPGESGQVSFQARVALLPSLYQAGISAACPPDEYPPAYVLPVPLVCDTTRFSAIGVTRQPPVPDPLTIQAQVPPGSNSSAMWLLMKGTDHSAPSVEGQPARLLATSHNAFGASLWTAAITSEMTADGQLTIVTYDPQELNALFLFDQDDPPFDETALDDFRNTTKTFTYTLDIPSVATQTMDVILPFMDITYWTDDLLPNTRMTEVGVEFDGQKHTVVADQPNLGNGLLMTQFPFTIGPFADTHALKVLTVTVDTQDSIYTLGPRVCRPVYLENTAWLCSQQAGCISSTVTNTPDDFMPYGHGGIYLPIIVKSYP